MARPALKEEDKRVVQVNIRLTEAENDRISCYSQRRIEPPRRDEVFQIGTR